jgi:hypothetical protein
VANAFFVFERIDTVCFEQQANEVHYELHSERPKLEAITRHAFVRLIMKV